MSCRHILVVEDSDEDFETVQDVARSINTPHSIIRATSGGECLRLLRSKKRQSDMLPLVLLLDLNTPGDDGRAVLHQIRTDDGLKTLPVVVLSTSANPRDLNFCYANGANAYHVKPVGHAAHLFVLQQIFTYWLGSVVLPPEYHQA